MFEIDENIIISEFFRTMHQCGISPKDDFIPILDGQIHRFSTENDRHGEKSGAYFIHSDGWPNGGVMDYHIHSEMQKFSLDKDAIPYDSRKTPMSQEDYEHMKAENEKRKQENLILQREEQQAATLRAWYEYRSPYSISCTEHPYLKHKGITNLRVANAGLKIKVKNVPDFHNICRNGDMLIPLVDAFTGAFMSLIHVSAKPDSNGKFMKHYYKDAPVNGSCCELIPSSCREARLSIEDNKPDFEAKEASCSQINADTLYICEGIATGFSILEILNNNVPVLCAGTCHNIIHVAKAWRTRYPEIKIIVCADNDDSGIQAAQKTIASGYADAYTMPPLSGMDWNDYLLHLESKDI